MDELIKIESRPISGATAQTVNARELHAFLENRDHFATWIKERIEQYGFSDRSDFTTYSANSEKGRPRQEYALTIDMAKELCMVERNEKGRQARQYFIECERRAKTVADPMAALNDPATMRGLLLTYSEKVLTLESQVVEMRPKVDALERIAVANGSWCFREAAKILQIPERQFYLFLQEHGWIYRHPMGKVWLAYSHIQKRGWIEHKVSEGDKSNGEGKWTKTQARVTSKGLAKLSELMGLQVPANDLFGKDAA